MKRNLKKQILSVVLVCTLVLSMVLMSGCGSSDPKPSNSSESSAVSNASESNTSEAGTENSSETSTASESSKEESSTTSEEYQPVDPSTVEAAAEEDFEFKIEKEVAIITAYRGKGGQVRIPDSLGGAEKITIGEKSFQDNDTITYIYFPENIYALESSAFNGCKALQEAVFACGSKMFEARIPNKFMQDCPELRRIEISGKIATIQGANGNDPGAFRNCPNLTELVLSESVKKIESNAFAFSGLTSVTLPSSIGSYSSLGNFAMGSKNLKEIIFTGESEFEILDGVVYSPAGNGTYTAVFGISGYPFEELVLREGTQTIEQDAFAYCQNLKSITIPASVTKCGQRAFSECPNLETAVMEEGFTTVEKKMFYACPKLVNVTVPSTLTTLNDHAFADCSSLVSITLPMGVTWENNVFYNTAKGFEVTRK